MKSFYKVTQSGMTHRGDDGKLFKLNVGDTIELSENQALARVGKVELVTEEELYGDADVAKHEPQKQGKKKGKGRK